MCSHYQTLKDAELLLKKFGVHHKPAGDEYDMWPGYLGVIARRPPEHDAGDEAVPEREATVGRWGMIPPGTPASKLANAGKVPTFNARSETAHTLWTFRNAWAKAQHCIIPAHAIFEPDWRPVYEGRAEKSVPTRFTRADVQVSYTMLTINADHDPLFRDYHQAGKEKRMVVILPEGAYGDWLNAPASATRDFLVPFPAERLVATPTAK
ncbi:SOS response-associated peptidase family protein [Achromobacter insuavis]|uniref:SOS response-associated peptidase family protein n=1 Tax=Achromobacter insuavis TaxID=1287735 RepID=UPI000AA3F855|nr:SOS response-associated peptidase family protein [Achromobacter insuavis]